MDTQQYEQNQKNLNKNSLHIPEHKVQSCRHEIDTPGSEVRKDYMRINSKMDLINMRFMHQKMKDDLKTFNISSKAEKPIHDAKLEVKKHVLNDYLTFVNKRQEFIDQMQASIFNLNEVQQQTNQYLEKYYGKGSYYREQIKKLVQNIGPGNGHLKQLVEANYERIERKISKTKKKDKNQQQQSQLSPLISIDKSNTSPTIQSSRLSSLSKIHQLQQMFKQRDEENIQFKEQKYQKHIRFSVSEPILERKEENLHHTVEKKKPQIKEVILDYQYRHRGVEAIKQNLFEKDMKDLTQKQKENLIEMALDAKTQNKNKGPLDRYIKKFQDSEFLYKTYREQVQKKEFEKALQVQQVIQAKAQGQQQSIDDLLTEQRSAQSNRKDYVPDNLIDSHQQIISMRELMMEQKSHKLSSRSELQSSSKRMSDFNTSQSKRELYQILNSKCQQVNQQNKKFFRSLNKQLKINRRGYGILNDKYNQFQMQCELGDHLEGLKIEHL